MVSTSSRHICLIMLLSLIMFAGCSVSKRQKNNVSPDLPVDYHPLNDVNSVAIMPITALHSVDVRSIPFDYSNTFASEWAKYGISQIVRPDYIRRFMKANRIRIRTSEDIVQLGKRLGVDLIVATQLTDYDPYNPPRVSLNVQVFSTTANASAEHVELERWMTSGVPYSIDSAESTNHPIIATELLVDANSAEIYKKLKQYALSYRNKETSYHKSESFLTKKGSKQTYGDYLNIMPKYFSFVSDHVIQTVLKLKEQRDLTQVKLRAEHVASLNRELDGAGFE